MEFSNKQIFQHLNLKNYSEDKWVIKEASGDEICSSESIGSFSEDSMNSESSLYSSSDLRDDASSPPSCTSSSSSSSNGPLYELSDLMAQLPIKRGLSTFYQGKSQSFTSLANANTIEDLAKKGSYLSRMKLKSCRSYGGGLDKSYSPKATICKKSSARTSYLGRRSCLGNGFRPSSISVMKNF